VSNSILIFPRSAKALREGEQAGHKKSKLKTSDACLTSTARPLY
jgi:hypothetical protein